MNSEIDKRALEILSRWDKVLYIDLSEPLRRGTGKAYYAEPDGVLVYVKGVWMIAARTAESAAQIAEIIRNECKEGDEVCAHGSECRQLMENCKIFSWYEHPCYVGAYLMNTVFDVPSELEIRKLDRSFAPLVSRTYTLIKIDGSALEKAEKMIEGTMFGGFEDDKCVGYIGLHPEGTMGMLEIFPEYRNRGFGTALEMFLINYVVQKGMVPFCHIWETNSVSLKMQKMLGIKIARDMVWWGKLPDGNC